ncbi:MAG: NAD(P)/FAD-dependent oxidoreductase [Desulfobacteraceae bacterium]|nr:NAD(P)/FAD-dependent oxidoreductase [Desulfobacteraceae bacterium]MCF8093950.1 NAD(P)/FAD-dependent oxidoreductase [Desulfobacteraceae bacterium]
MVEAPVIIIGGGPAGSTCARELKKHGIDVLVLDKQNFPRTKLCAGWITPKVLADLELAPKDYPHSLLTYRRIVFYIKKIPFPVFTHQYSIRRYEFDDFLLKRAEVPVYRHHAKDIRIENGKYVIDDSYKCTWLVGAGGTHCPVYKTLFSKVLPRDPQRCISTVEEEFSWQWNDPQCRLWFFEHGLPGYSWYVPKQNGFLNVGIGGKLTSLKKRGETINSHWNRFIRKLSRKGLVSGHRFSPKGHIYYLHGPTKNTRYGNAFLIGDAAGLATRDMGEGIGPAVESGKMAAGSIISGTGFSLSNITQWSVPQLLAGRFVAKNLPRPLNKAEKGP